MNLAILLVTIYIFLDNLGYAVYEFQNKNKMAGVCTIILNLFMIIFVNYVIFNFIWIVILLFSPIKRKSPRFRI